MKTAIASTRLVGAPAVVMSFSCPASYADDSQTSELIQIKKVFVASLGDKPGAATLRSKLAAVLAQKQFVEVVPDPARLSLRRIMPNPGLIDYVESGQLIVPWKERKLFLKEEESEQRLENHNLQLGYKEQSPMAHAMYEIYESVGDEVSFYKGALRCSPEALERLKIRAKADHGSNSPIAKMSSKPTPKMADFRPGSRKP